MTEPCPPLHDKIALVTGAAQRIGAEIARMLHGAGMQILIHYRNSRKQAEALQRALESQRPDSTRLFQADLLDPEAIGRLIDQVVGWRGQLDLLVNNASSFFPTPLGTVTEQQWDDLVGSNLRAPFFLSQAAAGLLRKDGGSIINLVDIHGDRPREGYPVYSMAKAGNAMMVKALALELGPEIRVNGVAPGAILWPEEEMTGRVKETIVSRTALKRAGRPEDVARAVLYLARDANYVTGQIIAVDGGRSIQQ